METSFVWRQPSLRLWFKSYYVVWKLCDESCKRCAYSEFKSYYVVWKHFHKNTVDEKEIIV